MNLLMNYKGRKGRRNPAHCRIGLELFLGEMWLAGASKVFILEREKFPEYLLFII
jgi:hypothetical protein